MRVLDFAVLRGPNLYSRTALIHARLSVKDAEVRLAAAPADALPFAALLPSLCWQAANAPAATLNARSVRIAIASPH